jgi:hypothetical protein
MYCRYRIVQDENPHYFNTVGTIIRVASLFGALKIIFSDLFFLLSELQFK